MSALLGELLVDTGPLDPFTQLQPLESVPHFDDWVLPEELLRPELIPSWKGGHDLEHLKPWLLGEPIYNQLGARALDLPEFSPDALVEPPVTNAPAPNSLEDTLPFTPDLEEETIEIPARPDIGEVFEGRQDALWTLYEEAGSPDNWITDEGESSWFGIPEFTITLQEDSEPLQQRKPQPVPSTEELASLRGRHAVEERTTPTEGEILALTELAEAQKEEITEEILETPEQKVDKSIQRIEEAHREGAAIERARPLRRVWRSGKQMLGRLWTRLGRSEVEISD